MNQAPEIIDGITCYAKDLAFSGEDFPVNHFDRLFRLEKEHFWFQSRNWLICHLIDKYLGDHAGNQFLELGCGTGIVLDAIHQRFTMKVVGAELLLPGLRFAKQRMADIDFVQLDARNMPYKQQFDGIGAFDVLEHIEEDQQAMDNVATALKPGGYFFITVPQHQWLWSEQDDIACHKRRYSRVQLLDRLEKCGFEICYVTSFVTTLLPLMAVSRKRSVDSSLSEQQMAEFYCRELAIPRWINKLLSIPMELDKLLVKTGASIPFGGSLVVVARKP